MQWTYFSEVHLNSDDCMGNNAAQFKHLESEKHISQVKHSLFLDSFIESYLLEI